MLGESYFYFLDLNGFLADTYLAHQAVYLFYFTISSIILKISRQTLLRRRQNEAGKLRRRDIVTLKHQIFGHEPRCSHNTTKNYNITCSSAISSAFLDSRHGKTVGTIWLIISPFFRKVDNPFFLQ